MSRSLLAALVCAVLTLGVSACGGDEQQPSTPRAAAPSGPYAGIKTYLLDHTTRLARETAKLKDAATRYDALARAAGYDHARMLRDKRAQVAALVKQLQRIYYDANPAYEEAEGVVAGVPSLADYDVIIDAGAARKDDPENAVPFDVKTSDGRTFKQPGNLFYLVETALYGTEPAFAAKEVAKPDLDGDGRVSFGEAVPEARFLKASADLFERYATELDAAAKAWRPTEQDVFTAVVVMTPTMSEYFEAWKNSRFVAGAQATQKAFVGTSRLSDIADILGGLDVVYGGIEPAVARVNAQQADQTGGSLKRLLRFVERLRDEEAGGRTFTAEEADALGSEAQSRAEAIAGQVSQSAAQLKIDLPEA